METEVKYDIEIQKCEHSRIGQMDFDNISFGSTFSDHMFVVDYENGAWQQPKIMPYKAFELDPSCSGLHYGQLIFEGMKAYKDQQGNGVLFRPMMNIKRFNISAARMAMPAVPEELFETALHQLLSLDIDWIPGNPGCSLYIRPYMFANEKFIGVKPSKKFRFAIITSPAGLYYPKPVRILAADEYVRAFPGGTGYAKAAGNYGATMQPLNEANEKGYDQILWLDGKEFKYVQEIGTMNVFFVLKDKVLTAPTDDGTILKGVTRDSVIQLLRDKGLDVQIRDTSIDELIEAHNQGNLLEIFGTGTAATIAQIINLGYKDASYDLPKENWELSNWIKKELEAIRTGKIEDPHGWNVKVSMDR